MLAPDILVLTALAVLALWLSPWALRRLSRRLRPGDRVRISRGLEDPAPWLSGRPHVEGQVVGFIPGLAAANKFAVVRLTDALVVERPCEARGEYVVLGLRHRGARWGSREVVAVWLEQRQPGAFAGTTDSLVESHAVYHRVA
jgi:hypothetical protein